MLRRNSRAGSSAPVLLEEGSSAEDVAGVLFRSDAPAFRSGVRLLSDAAPTDDDPEPVDELRSPPSVSADATPGIATAAPTPRKSASAPTRPMKRALSELPGLLTVWISRPTGGLPSLDTGCGPGGRGPLGNIAATECRDKVYRLHGGGGRECRNARRMVSKSGAAVRAGCQCRRSPLKRRSVSDCE